MNAKELRRVIRSLPRGLTFSEVSSRTGLPYQTARRGVHMAGYKALDGRQFTQRQNRRIIPENVNWRLANVEIARAFGVSRERVRAIRKQLGKRFVESRGRKPVA